MRRSFYLLIALVLLCSTAYAYHPKQIESYAKRVYPKKNTCVLRSQIAKEVAEADGYTCQYGIVQTGPQTYHSYLIMEKDGKHYEILR